MDYRDVFIIPPMSPQDFRLYQDQLKKEIIRGNDLLNSNLATDSDLGDISLFDTRAHRDIFSILLSMSDSLSNGRYRNQRGICCSTLAGAKGIGKTISLQAFTKICKKIFPNIYTVYISFNNILCERNRLQYTSLISILMTEIEKSVGILIPQGNQHQPLCELLIEYLMKNNINILVLVDELDQLYKSELESSLVTLHDLAYLGNQPSGRVSILVCGSSSMMEYLIRANGDSDVKEEFPLLKNAPNLNGTKFLTKRAYSSLPTDLQTVATIANVDYALNIPWVRIIAFSAGGSARQIKRVLEDSLAYMSQSSEVLLLTNHLVVIMLSKMYTYSIYIREFWTQFTIKTKNL